MHPTQHVKQRYRRKSKTHGGALAFADKDRPAQVATTRRGMPSIPNRPIKIFFAFNEAVAAGYGLESGAANT
jgi:hypothetical protein